jgi:predicted N-acetyltransferase YhbS
MTSFVNIILEIPSDVSARETLLDAALGSARFSKTSERLRQGRLPASGLAFSAKEGGKLVGTIRLWHIMAGGVPALLLGPLAIEKSHEGLGLGTRLMQHALSEAKQLGHKAIVLVGDAPYYTRFGFSRAATQNLLLPGPVDLERFLGLELTSDSLATAAGLVIATGEKQPLVRRAARNLLREKNLLDRRAA